MSTARGEKLRFETTGARLPSSSEPGTESHPDRPDARIQPTISIEMRENMYKHVGEGPPSSFQVKRKIQ